MLADGQPVVRVTAPALMSQMAEAGWIATADGAFLEMTLEDVAARECVFAQVA